MNSISNNPVYVEGIRYTAGLDNIQKNINQPQPGNVDYLKNFSQDDKNVIVSEKPDKFPGNVNFYRYQYSSPASRLTYTGQIFNEIEKPYKAGSSSSQGNQQSSNNNAAINYDKYNAVSGFYIFDNGSQKQVSKSSAGRQGDKLKKKIDKAYHRNYYPEPGSLVNMTYY